MANIIQQLEDLKEWAQDPTRYAARLKFRSTIPSMEAQIVPEEFDEFTPREEEYYKEPPFSTREEYRKGQLVQPGQPGVRQGYGREVDWNQERKANLKTWMDNTGSTLEDYEKASKDKKYRIREGEISGIKQTGEYGKTKEDIKTKKFRNWLNAQDPDIKSRNLQDLMKQSKTGVDRGAAGRIIDEPQYFKKFGNIKKGTKTRLSKNAIAKHLGGGLYKITSPFGYETYMGTVQRKGKTLRKHFDDIEDAKDFIAKKKKLPSAPSIIEQQSAKGPLLEQPKYKQALANAMDEVYAMENKGYGAIRELTQKYKDMFSKKGTTQLGTKITSDLSMEGRALVNAIRSEANKLKIGDVNSKDMEKALDFYKNKKVINKGDHVKIAKKFNVNYTTFQAAIQNKDVRRKIPLKYGSDAERKAALSKTRKAAETKYSSPSYEKFLMGTKDVQKGHATDIYTQHVTPQDIVYTPAKIYQEALKQIDAVHHAIYKKRVNLFKNKPAGWEKEIERLNAKGMKLAEASQGYKTFNIKNVDGSTMKWGGDPWKTIDPMGLTEGKKLSKLTEADKALIELNRPGAFERVAKMPKKQISKEMGQIEKNVVNVLAQEFDCAAAKGGRCDTPADFKKSFNENVAKAAAGDKDAGNKMNKFLKNMRKAKGAAKWTLYGLLAEIGFMVPFAAGDYAAGKSWKRILGNATDWGLGPMLGQSEQEEFEAALPEGSKAIEAQNIVDIGEQIDRFGTRSRGPMVGMDRGRYEHAQRDAYNKLIDEYNLNFQPFVVQDTGDAPVFSESLYDRAHQEAEATRARIAAQEAQRIKERQESGILAQPNWLQPYAGGGIANVRRPNAIPPDSGPMPQGGGLSSVFNRVKPW